MSPSKKKKKGQAAPPASPVPQAEQDRSGAHDGCCERRLDAGAATYPGHYPRPVERTDASPAPS